MKERFEGENRAHLIAALRRQEVSSGDIKIADALAARGILVEFFPGQTIIEQDGIDNDIYFLIAGVVGIVVNGAEIAIRKAGQHVGEMAAIEPSLPRSATVLVHEHAVTLKLSSAEFLKIGNEFPQIWRPISQELSKRLIQRNKTIMAPNKSPRLFIISSSEAMDIAECVRNGLAKDANCKVWNEGVFFAGGYPLEALEAEVGQSDFAVAIAQADDIIETRGLRAPTVRDNVLFELGLFMGKLTRYRAILVPPKVKDLKLPSDLQGLTVIPYEFGDPTTVTDRLTPVCTKIRELINRLGVRRFTFGKN